MKIFFCILITFTVLLVACSTKLNLTSTYKDITIVYGMLNKVNDPAFGDTTFIKINKAYLDPSTSALVIAKIADSLYYKNLTVTLQDDSDNNIITLVKVDGNLEGHVKQTLNDLGAPGIFATSPNYLYQTTQPINGGHTYQLNIRNNDNGKVVTASTNVIADFTVNNPASGTNISFSSSRNTIFNWQSAQNGEVYDLVAHFYYHEVNNTSQAVKDTFINWYIFKGMTSSGTSAGQNMLTGIPGGDFYTFVNSAIGDNPNVYRVADSMNFTFYVGGLEYYNYTQVALAQTGLTSSQVEPTYTDVTNGLGLFSSRASKNVYQIGLFRTTIDTLACGPITKHLGFHNSAGVPCN